MTLVFSVIFGYKTFNSFFLYHAELQLLTELKTTDQTGHIFLLKEQQTVSIYQHVTQFIAGILLIFKGIWKEN